MVDWSVAARRLGRRPEGIGKRMVGTAAAVQDAAPQRPVRSTYRPHLDGLHAVAVYLVVAFHSGLKGFGGGFVGVDVFFVLSGYLVTQLLLRDLEGTRRVGYQRFYARRFRRILPAAAITLIVTAVVYANEASRAKAEAALGGFQASFLYVANWYFIHQSTNYFAGPINASPVLHFWSLAVEEQFYFVWPLALGVLFFVTRRAGARQRSIMRGLVAAGCVLSAGYALLLARTDLTRAYYGTDTRVYQLLLGALLALTPQLFSKMKHRRRLARRIAPWALVGLLILASSVVSVNAVSRGVLVAVVTAVLIVAIESASRGWVNGTLSDKRVTYLGRISYGTYLWHWPVIVVTTLRYKHAHGITLFVFACVVATGLAALSYHLVEHRIRVPNLLDRRALLVIVGGLLISVISAVLIVPFILEPASSQVTGIGKTRPGAPELLDWRKAEEDIPPLPKCVGKSIERCVVVEGNGGPRVLVVGDSHAHMWLPGFESIARKEGFTLAAAITSVCPWQEGLLYVYDKAPTVVETCKKSRDDWYQRVIPEFDPDVVVLIDRPIDDAADPVRVFGPNGENLGARSAALEKRVADTSAQTVARLRRDGRNVVIIEPLPMPTGGFDPLNCLSSQRDSTKCAYTTKRRPTPTEQMYRRLAQGDGVWSFDIDRVVCPELPNCAAVVDNVIVKRDPGHVTATFAEIAAPQIEKLWDQAGVLTRTTPRP